MDTLAWTLVVCFAAPGQGNPFDRPSGELNQQRPGVTLGQIEPTPAGPAGYQPQPPFPEQRGATPYPAPADAAPTQAPGDYRDQAATAAAAAPTPMPPTATSGTPAPPVDPALEAARRRADQLLAEALNPPDDAQLTGRRITLLEVVSSTPDRGRQLAAVRVYWQLCQRVASFHYAWDRHQNLKQIAGLIEHVETTDPRGSLAGVRAEMLAAEARWQAARIELVAAQHELADLVGLPIAGGEPLPLPADAPHAGPYHTYFEQIYGGGSTSRAALLDRVLPLRQKAVHLAAEAVEAGFERLDQAGEAYAGRRGSLVALLEALDWYDRQRQVFNTAVYDYNREIAEYALTVPHAGVSRQQLVGMLIKTRTDATAGAVATAARDTRPPAAAPDVRPASLEAPLNNPPSPAPRAFEAGDANPLRGAATPGALTERPAMDAPPAFQPSDDARPLGPPQPRPDLFPRE